MNKYLVGIKDGCFLKSFNDKKKMEDFIKNFKKKYNYELEIITIEKIIYGKKEIKL